VHRYNTDGLAGLSNRRPPGPEPRLSTEQEAELVRWIEDGPDLARDGVVRWRCRDLQARIEREFENQLSRANDRQASHKGELPALVGASSAP
jgi:transposase